MVELVGVHGADQRDVVRHRADVWQQVAEFHAALAVWLEFALGSHQHRRLLFDEGEPYVGGHFLGQRFAAQFVQLGLGIEEVDVTRCAGHENENTALGLGRKVWPDVRQWVALGGEQVVLLKQRCQCCHADSACAGCQKIAPCKLSPIAGCLWINPFGHVVLLCGKSTLPREVAQPGDAVKANLRRVREAGRLRPCGPSRRSAAQGESDSVRWPSKCPPRGCRAKGQARCIRLL